MFPSSHCSIPSTIAFPQNSIFPVSEEVVVEFVDVVEKLVEVVEVVEKLVDVVEESTEVELFDVKVDSDADVSFSLAGSFDVGIELFDVLVNSVVVEFVDVSLGGFFGHAESIIAMLESVMGIYFIFLVYHELYSCILENPLIVILVGAEYKGKCQFWIMN